MQYHYYLYQADCDRYTPLPEGAPVLHIGYSDRVQAKVLLIFDNQATLY